MSVPVPVIVYPESLPVSRRRDDITRAIRDHQVVIVAGATGSGKTTQLPKMCLELGRESIAHTQPRRLAARTIAERVAEELGQEVGGLVGYRVRFTDKVGRDTRIALMTDGILLNEIHRDRLLRRYDTIIIDEAHERSLNIDFLLGYLKRILPERPELRVIVTSATIDPESFARFFAEASGEPAPIIEVSGRTFPVDVRYRPLVAEKDPDADGEDGDGADDKDYLEGIVAGLAELDREAPGDVLVFLSGEAEIKDAAEAVRGAYAHATSPTEVLPLYGRLSAADQHRVFEPSKVAGLKRRVVLATNVAETSLTVPGIRYVIDAGTARISRYSARSKVQRLPIEAISQASAQQRSGRAGRTSDGIAIRLYSEEDFERRPEFTEPEILRTSLASVILQMLSLGFGDLAEFPFIQPPDSRGIKDGIELLTELGAIRMRRPRTGERADERARDNAGERAGDAKRAATPELTRIGRDLARLPIDPRFARMVIESARQHTGREVLAIVAGLTVQDVRERPLEHRERADQLHARFTDPTSDFLSLLNLWNYLQKQQGELGSSAFRRLCRSEHLNYLRVREWQDVYRQLRQLSASVGVTIGEPAVNPDGIHRSLLAGLLSHIGVKDASAASRAPAKRAPGGGPGPRPKGDYIGARHVRFAIFPGSGLAKKQPNAVMAAELVETSRLFARTVAQIDPAWAEPLAGDLAKRSVSEPHWEKSQGAAVAYEKVTLYGVEIIPRRRIQFSRIDPEGARELFIRHALVEGEWDASRLDKRLTAFDRDNRSLRRRLEEVEERTRRRDILVDDEAVVEFYDARIPRDIASVRAFERWWRDARPESPELLTMREADLLPEEAESAEEHDETRYPSHWQQGDQRLSLSYRFEPGASDDGVTVVVPLPLLASLRPDGFDWQVPGSRTELIAALIRALPKAIRRHVVPAADYAARFAEELEGQGPESHAGLPPRTLRAALAERIAKTAYQRLDADTFEMDRVPDHLQIAFRAVDERGRTLGSDADLAALQAQLAGRARESVARTTASAKGARAARTPAASGAAAVAGARGGGAGAAAAGRAGSAAVRERSGITKWDMGEVPHVVDTPVAGGVVRGYPALVDDGESVSLRIEATPERQRAAMRGGVRRLVLLAVASPVSYVQEHLSAAEKLTLAASPYPSARALIEDCRVAVADQLIATVAPDGVVFDRASFERARDAVSAGMVDGLFAAVALTARILGRARDAERLLASQNSMVLLGALTDVRSQLAGLVHPRFVSRTGVARLPHLLRYLNAVVARLEGLADNPARDRQRMTEYERAAALFTAAGGAIPLPEEATPTLERARWLLEELRVSVFAQQLGTPEPVSVQRVAKALQAG
ncbi:MAG: ATP-dependent RNA helicase HrpA [Microbacteriaceae bacterium]|jgi:ATP-dependent helicase HrpA